MNNAVVEGIMDNNVEVYDVNDLDQNIEQRKKLIDQAKALAQVEVLNDAIKEANKLRRLWKRIPYQESLYEDALMEEFEDALSVYYHQKNELVQANKQAKQELIKKAQELCNASKASGSAMNELMDQWKQVGQCGKEEDDALWQEFNTLRKDFFDKKHRDWEEMQSKFANAKEVKEQLIEQAESLKDSQDFMKTSDLMNEMLEKWKAVGRAGKEFDDELWARFSEARQVFYDRRKEYLEKLHESYREATEKKNALIIKAKDVLATQEFNRENTEIMKQLGVDWKAAGFAGKEHDDRLWKEFRETLDQYFDGLKTANQQRHAQWQERVQQSITRKEEFLNRQKTALQRLEQEKEEVISDAAVAEINEEIADKEAFITQLEEELAALKQKLN